MAFELPFPPFPHDSRDVPFIATPDDNNGYAVPSSQYFKKLVGEKYLWTPVSSDDPMPSSDVAAQAQLAEILAKLSADPATQTTLAAILEKIIAAPATEAKQTALNALIGEVQTSPTANTLLARLKNLETKVDAIIADGLKLSGSKVTVKRINLTSSTEIAATTGTETVAVVVPAGKIWTVQVLRINANAIVGATGNHRLLINIQEASIPLLDTLGQAAIKSIAYMYGQFVDITAGYSGYTDLTGVLPSDKNSQLDGIKGLKMVAGHTLNIVYNNYSDKPQTETRTIYLSVIEEDIVV